jgi:hypothetical protein
MYQNCKINNFFVILMPLIMNNTSYIQFVPKKNVSAVVR